MSCWQKRIEYRYFREGGGERRVGRGYPLCGRSTRHRPRARNIAVQRGRIVNLFFFFFFLQNHLFAKSEVILRAKWMSRARITLRNSKRERGRGLKWILQVFSRCSSRFFGADFRIDNLLNYSTFSCILKFLVFHTHNTQHSSIFLPFNRGFGFFFSSFLMR